ncbi:hypothetical protein SCYAM73S_03548 [Streptomyces cyaneofuscatus]|uniref:hypothetical protein n=1 Tax=Streptomyces cyaneofuscatus TaxID=66883 RepID=UPI0004CAA977|nr:hypothetical protein [Streptomyces cyaneofuscatus]
MSMRKRVSLVALCMALAGAGIAVSTAQGGTESASSSTTSDPETTESDAVQACADSWNNHNGNKGNIASIATAAQGENPTAYVHVGFSSVFPDRCLIAVANPSTLYAQQYLQDGPTGWPIVPAWTGSASDLDASTLQWNARMATSGTVIVL